MDFEKIFEMFSQVEKGETFRLRLPKLGENSQKSSQNPLKESI